MENLIMTATVEAGGLTGAVDTVLGVTTKVFEFIFSNPLLLIFLGAGLIPVAVGIFRKMKKSAK